MLRSRFFWKLYTTYVVLVALTTATIGFLVSRRMEQALVGGLEESLRDKAAFLVPYALDCFLGREEGVQERIGSLARETDTRITLILPDGVVLADSDQDPARMENHGARPEIVQARTQLFGVARRVSATVGYRQLYVARLVGDGRGLGFVRVALPLRLVGEQVAELRTTIALGAGAALLAALGIGLLAARHITAPIARMTAMTEQMRAGIYGGRLPVEPQDEIGELADALNRLGREVAEKIGAISADRARLEAMVAGIVEGVIAVDEDGRIMFCNAAACRLLDLDSAGAAGRRFDQVFPADGLAELLGRARTEDAAVRSEVWLPHEGREIALEVNATPFRTGESRGVVMVFHDISDIRALERVRRDFVANVSHELKTPLTSIKGYVETLLDDGGDSEMRVRFLEKIAKNADRLSHLVSDLLSLSRIESAQTTIKRQPVDWAEMLADAARSHEDAVRRQQLSLEVRPGSEPVVVLGDPEAITEILDNLLDNAIKYTPQKGRIRLVLSKDEESGTLTVEDTGTGIPAEDLDRIFERFYRVDKARSRELGGSGLGLSIVKHLVQSMEGEVSVRSRVGEGSCFTVRLPLAGPRPEA